MGYMISSKTTIKVEQLDKHIGMTIAGGVGDAQKLVRWMKGELELYRIRENTGMTVKGATTLLANVLSNYKYYPFFVQLIVGGYDSEPRLYNLDMAGGVTEDKYIATGSGSPFVYGLLENEYDKKMNIKECLLLATKCITISSKRDIASGNGVTIATVTPKGLKYLKTSDIEKIGAEISNK